MTVKGNSLAIAVPTDWRAAADQTLRDGYSVGVTWRNCGPTDGNWTYKITQFYLAPEYAAVLTGEVVHPNTQIQAVVEQLVVHENAGSYSLSDAVVALLFTMGDYVVEEPPADV